jgi:ABC-type transport system involved in multi-copper enzyme maturation permease subunit
MENKVSSSESANRPAAGSWLTLLLGRGLALLALFVKGFFKDRKGQLLVFIGLLPVAMVIATSIVPSAPYPARLLYLDIIRLVYGTLLVPLFGLLLGTAAVSEEMESHTIMQIVSRPVTRVEIVVWRYAATIAAGSITAFIATGIMYAWFGLVAGIDIGLLIGSWAFLTACNSVYCAIFMLLGIALSRPLFWGVLVVLYEQLLGAVFSFIGGAPYSLSAHMSNMGNIFLEFHYQIPGWSSTSSVTLLLVILIACLLMAAFLFHRKDLS